MNNLKLEEWLYRQIRKNKAGHQLPVDKELAKAFNVSVRTVSRKMQLFVQQGVISRVQGKGTFISGQGADPDPSVDDPTTSPQQVAKALEKSIRAGDFKSGETLPSLKYISLQFNISYRTAIRAYRILASTGKITKIGKTFWVGRVKDLVHPPRNREVFLLNYKNSDFSELYRPDILGLAYQKMEKELLSNGYLVRYDNTDNLTSLIRSWKKNRSAPSGVVLCYVHVNDYQELLPVLRRARQELEADMPPLLFDWRQGKYDKAIPGVQLFIRGNILSSAARTLTDYLHRKKFGKAVIFMSEAGFTWSFPAPSLVEYRCFWEMQKLDPAFHMRFVVRPYNMEKKHLDYLHERRLFRQVREHSKGTVRVPDEQTVKRVARRTHVVAELSERFELCRDFPIWIFSRSRDAAEAYEWAGKHNIRIPEDLSIVTLENDPKYFHLGLTYCGPDWDTIGYLMAHALIKDFSVAKTSKGFIRTNAVVIEKLTTE